MPEVLFEKRPDGVALITLNRPERLNSLGGELVTLLADALIECEEDAAVRCVALTGAGRAFCAGGDVGGMKKRNEGFTEKSGDTADILAGLEHHTIDLKKRQNSLTLEAAHHGQASGRAGERACSGRGDEHRPRMRPAHRRDRSQVRDRIPQCRPQRRLRRHVPAPATGGPSQGPRTLLHGRHPRCAQRPGTRTGDAGRRAGDASRRGTRLLREDRLGPDRGASAR